MCSTTHLLCDASVLVAELLADTGLLVVEEELVIGVEGFEGLLPLGLGLITPASTPALLSFTLCCLIVERSVLSELVDLEVSLKIEGGGGDGTSLSTVSVVDGTGSTGAISVLSPVEFLLRLFLLSFSKETNKHSIKKETDAAM